MEKSTVLKALLGLGVIGLILWLVVWFFSKD